MLSLHQMQWSKLFRSLAAAECASGQDGLKTCSRSATQHVLLFVVLGGGRGQSIVQLCWSVVMRLCWMFCG